ncbi:enoyl-CoA hydratase/isomerase family protein [Rhodobacteraceae bacterium KMM 6894]|nr:enoyl-CoA hydratase/isomerase family protein [Rhodobacteraceae bacterium KMM 6894]
MSVVLSDICDGIATVTLNRPEKRNALSPELVKALTSTLLDMAQTARVIVLRGAGKSFCAGADLGSVGHLETVAEFRAHATATGLLLQTIEGLTIPVIAAVQGHALGAGCGLVSACDLVVASPDAQFGYPELGHGMLPALVVPPLVRAVGKRQAFRLLTCKTRFTSDDALACGLISEIAAPPENTAQKIAQQLSSARAGQLSNLKTLIAQCDATRSGDANRAAIEANIADRLARMG